MPITLVLNPRDDPGFVALAEAVVGGGIDTPLELQARLRTDYPGAVARARELDGEAQSIWYVYRDGHWIPKTAVEPIARSDRISLEEEGIGCSPSVATRPRRSCS